VPLFPVPNFPTYPSNHSTYSADRSEILAYLFPTRADFIRAIGNEAGDSRIWAGIHFPMDNIAGKQLGRSVAQVSFHGRSPTARSEGAAFFSLSPDSHSSAAGSQVSRTVECSADLRSSRDPLRFSIRRAGRAGGLSLQHLSRSETTSTTTRYYRSDGGRHGTECQTKNPAGR
jgi:PAP2 superfamily